MTHYFMLSGKQNKGMSILILNTRSMFMFGISLLLASFSERVEFGTLRCENLATRRWNTASGPQSVLLIPNLIKMGPTSLMSYISVFEDTDSYLQHV